MEKAKQNREWRREYMTLLMRDQENLERGIKQGIKQGIEQQYVVTGAGMCLSQGIYVLNVEAEIKVL